MTKAPYLICYDVRQPRRLRHIHRYLQDVAVPLQYSVFLARLNAREWQAMTRRLRRLTAEEDDVRVFPVEPPERAVWFGAAARPAMEGLFWVD